MRLLFALMLIVLSACVKTTPTTTPPPVSFANISDFQTGTASTSQICVQPGLYAISNYAFPSTIGGCVTFASGSGDAKIFVDEDGQLITSMRTGIKVAAETGQMTHAEVDTPVFPPNSLPICDLTVTEGAYKIDACGLATRLRSTVIKAGYGLRMTPANGKVLLEVDPAQLPSPPEPGPSPASGMVIPVWFPAATARADGGADAGSGWTNKTTANGGASLGSLSSATHGRAYLIFPPAEERFAQLNYLLPANWTPPLGMRIGWQSADLSAAGSLFDLRVATQCVKAGTRFTNSAAWNPEQSSVNGITGLNVDTDEDWQIAAVADLSMGKCAAGDFLSIQFRRDPAGSMTTGARLFGVELLVAVKP